MERLQNKYDVSVIIPTYNRSCLLNYTLKSLVKQDIGKDRFEVVVADDGSSDDTREVVRKFKRWLNVKYVFQEDRGYRPASARNKGICASEGNICLFIDAGVILHPGCIASHVDFHAGNRQRAAAIGYVYGFENGPGSEDKLIKMIAPEDPVESIRRLSRNPLFFDVREEQYKRHNDKLEELPAPWYYFWTCHVSVLRLDLVNVGLFDENYDGRWGAEDNDLGFRLQESGTEIRLLRAAKAIHYPHDKDKTEKRKQGYLNCIYFHNKFQTRATRLFLDNYHTETRFVDLNELLLQLAEAVA